MNGMGGATSLLSFIGAPVVVGDPEGRVVYVNPAFEVAMGCSLEEAGGEPLASLFSGGGRESILGAVATVCGKGQPIEFRLREADSAYLGLASPILAEEDRVGVIILLTREPATDRRLLAYQSEIGEPIREAQACLESLLEQTGGRRDERHRLLVEQGLGSLDRAAKWNAELHRALHGSGDRSALSTSLDPTRTVRHVVQLLEEEARATGVSLQILAPARLRPASGDGSMLETALVRLVRHRLAEAVSGDTIFISARACGRGRDEGLVFSVTDPMSAPMASGKDEPEPGSVRTTAGALGGRLVTLVDDRLGRVTSLRLPPAEAS